jgi:hypothetical protein
MAEASEPFALKSGVKVRVVRIQTRQLFRLIRMFTQGVGPAFLQTLKFDGSGEAFTQQLLTLLMISLPQAEDAAIDFFQAMVEPAALHQGRRSKLKDDQFKENQELWSELADVMFNPDFDDVIAILERVVAQEGPEIQSLGKRLAGVWGMLQKSGALGTLTSPEMANGKTSAEPTPVHST